jgi:ABC-type bacteriocin/lantibiotic exporter with double-glycine peptidase domain
MKILFNRGQNWMKAVQQKHVDGCGPAALTMVLCTSYDKALKIVHPNRRPRGPANTPPFKLKDAMQRIKLHHKEKRLEKWEKLEQTAIVSITWKSGLCHWVVWDADKKVFLDPCSKWVLKTYGKYDSYMTYVNAFNRGQKRVYLIEK